ncbi:MAG: hypothetical protein ABR975_06210 [Vulcanimicrobiaceae bacterium]|jgi:hypothetical protein
MSDEPETTSAGILKGLRIDLLIAICALFMSSLATAGSWWQTHVIQQQLNAQVWPYVTTTATLNPPAMTLTLSNDGLGPAVMGSIVATVDGKPQHSYVAVLHALVGPNLMKRSGGKAAHAQFSLGGLSVGSVLPPGTTKSLFTVRSDTLALPLAKAFGRLAISTCFCAIVPGECWQTTSSGSGAPQRVSACPEIADDLLHDNLSDVLKTGL